MSDEPEIYELDLDWDLANHLANQESFAYLRAETFSRELIEDEYIEKVWDWATDHYREHGQPASASVLEDQFDDLALDKPLTAIGDLVQRLRERYVRNTGRDKIKEIGTVWKTDPLATSKALLDAGRELAKLTAARGEAWGTGDHDRSILEYHRKVAKGPGPSLGFDQLDDYFMGQNGVTFWLGAPKSMKTWTGPVKGIVENVRAGREVYAYSLELPAYELNMRVRCMAADVPWWRFLKNKMEDEHIAALAAASEELDDLGGFHILKPPMEERSAENIITKAGDAGADVIYIDQLQYLVDSKGVPIGERNDPGLYWGVGNKLRDYSDDIPLFVVHQFNRSVMNADQMPEMQQAKGGSMIEEVGTLVMGLWSNKDMRASKIMELGTLASRNYDLVSWEVAVNMQKGCGFNITGRVADE